MKKVSILLIIFFAMTPSWALDPIDKNPPIGVYPTHDFKAGFLLRDDQGLPVVPQSLGYDQHGAITLTPFPKKEISVYVKVKQESGTAKEGAIMLKYKRQYGSRVIRSKRGKVTLWIGKGFYKDGQKLTAIPEKSFTYSEYEDYTYPNRGSDGIRKYLSVATDKSSNFKLNDKRFRESMEFLDNSNLEYSLLTTCFIHFLNVAGQRWHRIDIPIADGDKDNLQQVSLEIYLIIENTISLIDDYTIKG